MGTNNVIKLFRLTGLQCGFPLDNSHSEFKDTVEYCTIFLLIPCNLSEAGACSGLLCKQSMKYLQEPIIGNHTNIITACNKGLPARHSDLFAAIQWVKGALKFREKTANINKYPSAPRVRWRNMGLWALCDWNKWEWERGAGFVRVWSSEGSETYK